MAAAPPLPPLLISKAVGLGGANIVGDVQKIAYLLNIIAHGPMLPLEESGVSKPALKDRIKFVQLTLVGMQAPDGNIGPKGATLRALGRQAALLVIAYEGHHFRNGTDGDYDRNWPLLSYKYVKKAGAEWQANNKTQDTAWKTLATAASLDVNAALTACSWGRFQIMGFHFKTCGYADALAFVEGMKAGEAEQLAAFIAFCRSLSGFAKAMVDKDYKKLASSYNGTDYGDYDQRIEKAYKALTKK